MTDIHENPCKGCTRNCCIPMGLFLSEDEYLNHFQQYSDGLLFRRSQKIIVATPKEGLACPHLEHGGCRIYHERPIDCRVYPYVLIHMIERLRKVKIVFHTRTDCPQKDRLYQIMPESEARALLMALGKKVYGEEKSIIVCREGGIASRVRNRIEAAIFRRLNKLK